MKIELKGLWPASVMQRFQKQPWFGSSREERSVSAELRSDLSGAQATTVWSVLKLVSHYFTSQNAFQGQQ